MHVNFDPNSPAEAEVLFNDFLKLDIRIGEVINIEGFPEARTPSYKVWLDFGCGVGVKKSSAQITDHYKKEELVGRKLLAVINFPKRQIAGFLSEALVLGLADKDGKIVLLNTDQEVPKGSRLL